MIDNTKQTVHADTGQHHAELAAGFAAPAPTQELTIEERLAALENSIHQNRDYDDFNRRVMFLERSLREFAEHSARLQGADYVLAFLAVVAGLDRAQFNPNPYQWIERDYIPAVMANLRKVDLSKNVDPIAKPFVDAGIELAIGEFFKNLMALAADLHGAPTRPQA